MKEYKIFIASSNDEKDERNAIESLLQTATKYSREYGIEFSPVMWEMESVDFLNGFNKKQSEYNDKLASSDIAVFLFGDRVGYYTREEFDVACEKVAHSEKIKVFVYFKPISLKYENLKCTVDINMVQQRIDDAKRIKELKDYISKELKQVYGEYESISELLIKFMGDILKIVLPNVADEKISNNDIQRLNELYKEIKAPVLMDKRDDVITNAINSLYFLKSYNLAPADLNDKNFYDLLHLIISNTRKGAEINALSVMLKSEWNDSDAERTFWRDNQDAVKRRVDLERIFIVGKNEAHRLKTIPQIKKHISLEKQYSNIHSYIIEKEKLQDEAPQLLEGAGNGFIMIKSKDERIVLLDEIPEAEKRAIPVLDKEKIDEILELFESIKKLAKPLEDYLNNIAWSHYKKEMISIFVTTKCNLNCDYCFTNKNENEHKGQTISYDFVKKGIDDYFKEDYMRHVRFFGAGEPTVEFELIKRIHSYAVTKGGDAVTFEIQTNGAFHDNVANWLKNNIDIIWISCDGTPDIQNLHRPFFDRNETRKTSEIIEKNIRILVGPTSKAFVGIRSTITSENIMRQKEMIDYFYQLGIKDIWVDPLFPSVGKKPAGNVNEIDMLVFANEFLEAARYAKQLGVFYGSILTCNFNDSVNRHCRACLPVPHLTTDGYVSACDMALFGEDNNHMSPLIYGKWDEKQQTIIYYSEKIDIIRSRTIENMHHCEICRSKEHCGGYCLGEVLNETGNLFGQKKGACSAIRYLDENLDLELREYKHTHP